MNSRTLARAGLVSLLLLTSSIRAQTQQYYVVTQQNPPTGASTDIHFLNDNGDTLGNSDINGSTSYSVVLWRGGKPTVLPNPGFDQYVADGINNVGGIAGTASDFTAGSITGIYWVDGAAQLLPGFSPDSLNDSGTLTGQIDLGPPNFGSYPVTWKSGVFTKLPLLTGGTLCVDLSISPNGTISATCDDPTHSLVAVIYRKGVIQSLGTIGTLGLPLSIAESVNDAGQVVGSSDTNIQQPDLGPGGEPFYYSHAALWKNGVVYDLGTLRGGTVSVANSINASGAIVGNSTDANNLTHAVMWQNGKIVDLNALFSSLIPRNVVLSDARKITDNGKILVEGYVDSTTQFAINFYVFSPVIPTRIVVSSTANPASYGQSVKIIAQVVAVSGAPPISYVTFREGSNVLHKSSIGSNGFASYTSAGLSVGSHRITVDFNGYAPDGPSTSPTFTQKVMASGTKTVVSSTANPATHGQKFTLTATVVPAYGTIAGVVKFKAGNITLGTVPVVGRTKQAALATTIQSPGKYSITADYSGTANFTPSTSPPLALTVR